MTPDEPRNGVGQAHRKTCFSESPRALLELGNGGGLFQSVLRLCLGSGRVSKHPQSTSENGSFRGSVRGQDRGTNTWIVRANLHRAVQGSEKGTRG
jgi:hypothetical protein